MRLPPVSRRKASFRRSAICPRSTCAGAPPPAPSPAGCRPAAGDLRHVRRVVFRELKLGRHHLGAFDEQPHRFELGQLLQRRQVAEVGHPSGGTRKGISPATPRISRLLARMVSFGAACSSAPASSRRPPPGARSCPGSAAAAFHAGNPPGKLTGVLPGCSDQPQRADHGLRDQRRVGQRGQLHQPDPVREVLQQLAATCSARRVLPVPPEPVRVSRRVSSSSAAGITRRSLSAAR